MLLGRERDRNCVDAGETETGGGGGGIWTKINVWGGRRDAANTVGLMWQRCIWIEIKKRERDGGMRRGRRRAPVALFTGIPECILKHPLAVRESCSEVFLIKHAENTIMPSLYLFAITLTGWSHCSFKLLKESWRTWSQISSPSLRSRCPLSLSELRLHPPNQMKTRKRVCRSQRAWHCN